MLLRLLRQVGSMIKMLRLSQVKYSCPKNWNAKFAKQIKLNCEITSFLQGQRLFGPLKTSIQTFFKKRINSLLFGIWSNLTL